MKRITNKRLEAVRETVRQHVAEYEKETGFGPCGGIAVVLARAGWGELAMLETTSAKESADFYAWYPHYVVVRNDKVLDVCGEYLANAAAEPVYRDIETLTEAELLAPGCGQMYGNWDVAFWQERLADVI